MSDMKTDVIECMRTIITAQSMIDKLITKYEIKMNSEVDLRSAYSNLSSAMDGLIIKLHQLGMKHDDINSMLFGGRRFKQ